MSRGVNVTDETEEFGEGDQMPPGVPQEVLDELNAELDRFEAEYSECLREAFTKRTEDNEDGGEEE